MHVRLKLREPNGLVIPKGPNFARAQTIQSDFDETQLRFRAPKHRASNGRPKEVLPKRSYQLNDIYHLFRMYGDGNYEDANHLEYYECFRRFWTFYGPWLTGRQAELQMDMTLIMPVNFDNEFSLYHPRAFEKLVSDYLIRIYGNGINPVTEGPSHMAPVNWQPLIQFPTPAARLDAVPTPGGIEHDITTWIFFTLSDNLLASVSFEFNRILNLPKEELDKRVSVETMAELMNQIIDSFQLTLSDQAKQQQQAALEGLEDTSVTKDFPPIDWAALKDGPGHDQKKLKN